MLPKACRQTVQDEAARRFVEGYKLLSAHRDFKVTLPPSSAWGRLQITERDAIAVAVREIVNMAGLQAVFPH
jgi:hypothetical protein